MNNIYIYISHTHIIYIIHILYMHCRVENTSWQERQGPRPHVALGALRRLHGGGAVAAHELGSQAAGTGGSPGWKRVTG